MIGMWLVRASAFQDPCRIEAGHLGQLYVHEYEIRQFLLRQGHAALAVTASIRRYEWRLSSSHDLRVVSLSSI